MTKQPQSMGNTDMQIIFPLYSNSGNVGSDRISQKNGEKCLCQPKEIRKSLPKEEMCLN